MQADIELAGKTCEQVFAVLGDPTQFPDWYLLAKEIRMHPAETGGSRSLMWCLRFLAMCTKKCCTGTRLTATCISPGVMTFPSRITSRKSKCSKWLTIKELCAGMCIAT